MLAGEVCQATWTEAWVKAATGDEQCKELAAKIADDANNVVKCASTMDMSEGQGTADCTYDQKKAQKAIEPSFYETSGCGKNCDAINAYRLALLKANAANGCTTENEKTKPECLRIYLEKVDDYAKDSSCEDVKYEPPKE